MSATVTVEQVEKKVFASLIEFGADPQLVSREAGWEVLEVDSLDLVELAQVVEDEFGVSIETKKMPSLTTVGSVIDLVVERAGA